MDTNGLMKTYKIKIKNPVMGVPISIVLFSPNQFEIVGDTNPLARGGLINGKYTYKRVPVRLRKKD